MKYSLIVPVYNRPEEVAVLLKSLESQDFTDFEAVIVEDGSTRKCDAVCAAAQERMALRYFYKENGGPGPARNFAAERARGEYLIFLDSDVIVPPGYMSAVEAELSTAPAQAFGGPDRAHASFTPVQKAINYSMTSFFTTGGIRGGKKKLDRFYPRSFNLGIRADLFRALGGFSQMRFGEDIDLSIRIYRSGAACRLFPEAWVYHKRRTDFRKFFRQVQNSGRARIALWQRWPDSLKIVHLFPALFTLSCITVVIPLCYALLIFIHATLVNRSLQVGLLSVPAAFIQLTGYGTGFLSEWWKVCVCKDRQERTFGKDFEEKFYK